MNDRTQAEVTTIPDIAYWSPEQVRDYLDRVFPLLDEMGEALANMAQVCEVLSGEADACIFCGDASGSDHAKECVQAKAEALDSRYHELRQPEGGQR